MTTFSFTDANLRRILAELKNTTRRPRKGEIRNGQVVNSRGRVIYQVGKTYTVTYGRAKPGAWWRRNLMGMRELVPYDVHRNFGDKLQMTLNGFIPFKVQVTSIVESDARWLITQEIQVEGYPDYRTFIMDWAKFYEKRPNQKALAACGDDDSLRKVLATFEAARWECHAITFALVDPSAEEAEKRRMNRHIIELQNRIDALEHDFGVLAYCGTAITKQDIEMLRATDASGELVTILQNARWKQGETS